MKGLVKVAATKCLRACEAYKESLRIGEEVRDRAIQEFHRVEYAKEGWFGRFLHRKSSPGTYLRSKANDCDWWGVDLTDVLKGYLTPEEEVHVFTCENHWDNRDSYREVKSLADASSQYVLLGPELAKFVNKWGEK